MKTALVISLGSRSTAENYGAVLQMAAFCQILKERYNFAPTILDYIGVNGRGYHSPCLIGDVLFGTTIKGRVKKILFGSSITKRFNQNLVFLKRLDSMTDLYDYENISCAHFSFDFYFAESDVIWDPSFRKGGFDDVFFLSGKQFSGGKKCIYAAGLGDAKLSEKEEKELVSKCQGLKNISARERYASNYLSKLLGQSIPCVLDPTLLVDESFYRRILTPKNKKSRYVVLYSPAFNNQQMISDAYAFAKKNFLKIIVIKRLPSKSHLKDTRINVDVGKFVSLIYGCECLFCDSFHGVCLSVCFRKQFYVYPRQDGAKIVDLCERLNLTKNLIIDNFSENVIDYKQVTPLLDKERSNSFAYLDDCVKG